MPKALCFHGSQDVTREQILDRLGVTASGSMQKGAQQPMGVLAGGRDGIPASSIQGVLATSFRL